MERLLKSASSHAPVFKVKAADVLFLDHPEEFYRTILKRIEESKEKIMISSLYIGTDELSSNLVLLWRSCMFLTILRSKDLKSR